MKLSWIYIAFLSVCLTLQQPLKLGSQSLNFRNYSVEDGLAQSQVLSLFQDSKGYIWAGTNGGGLSKFDGNKFTTITTKNGLINNVVFSIAEDKTGNIYFGTNAGLSIYDGKKFTNLTDSSGLPHNRILKILCDKKGRVWIGTRNGICTISRNKIIPFSLDKELGSSPIINIFETQQGDIWFGSFENYIFRFREKKVRKFVLNEDNNYLKAINEDSRKNVWVGTRIGLVKILTNDSIQYIKELNDGFSCGIRAENNITWFGTSFGILKHSNGTFTRISEKNGLPSDNILCSMVDNEGNLWFGTNGKGIVKLADEAFVSYGLNDGLPDEVVNAVYIDKSKAVWVGIQNSGLCKIEDNKVKAIFTEDMKNKNSTLVDNDVQAIMEDRSGRLWIGTKAGISIYEKGKIRNYTTEEGLAENNIYSFLQDKNGRIWIGSKNGIILYNEKEFTSIDAINKNIQDVSKAIFQIFEDNIGNLWFATEKGLLKFDQKTVISYTRKNGFTDARVLSITEDKEGNLWLGTNEGVFKYDQNKFIFLEENIGLASNRIYLLNIDNENNLWIGSNKGLDKLNLHEYNTSGKIALKHYGKENGFKGLECNANATCKDSDGRLWFGTIKGINIFDPHLEKFNSREPRSMITGIRLFFKSTDLSTYSEKINPADGLPVNLTLPFNQNHITFDFIGISYTIPEKVRYTYMLEGADKHWITSTSKNEAAYPLLPPGEYTFRLKAMNNDGVWNKKPVSFSFIILPPWYQTWWFYGASAIIVLAGFYAYTLLRTRNLQQAKVTLEREVRNRTKELREEKEKVEGKNKEISEQKNTIEAKNRDITDSINYAKNIQEALLPSIKKIHKEFKDCFILYLPKDIVSGDFYWYARKGNTRFIASVDCTGHGVPGAFMSIIGNNLLQEIVGERNISQPDSILNELHMGVKNALKQEDKGEERRDGMDIALCCIDQENGRVQFSGAMRPLWIIRKSGEFETIKPDKFPIGGLDITENRMFTKHEVNVSEGDNLYLFSDGYSDQFGGPKGKKLMLRNFQKLLSGMVNLSMKEQRQKLEKYFYDWKGNLEQIDDVLVIGFRVQKTEDVIIEK